MAKRNLISKQHRKKGAQERWKNWEDKREERKAQTQRARQAYLAKKTALQHDPDAEMPQASAEEPSTSEATAQENDGPPPSTQTPMTPQEMDVPTVEMTEVDVPFPSTLADDDRQAEPVPSTSTARCDLVATPSTSKGAGGFGLDDVHMFDELRRRHIWTEEELQRQRRSNAFLRKQLKAQRDRNGQRIIDAICAEADVRQKGDDIQRRLSEAGVRRHPRTKQFTGGDIYKILDHPNFASFTAPIPPGPLKFTLIDAMNDLRQIYHLSRAKILHPVDLNSLEHWTKMFYCHWQQLRSIDVDRYPVRPKLHLLTAHVVPFARSHLWWGLISEQGMEHMHRMCNNLVGRYSHLGTQEKVVEKLVKHTTMLNALHDRGVEDKKENDKYPDF
ncbi:hypothetical protein niasHT_031285 [Heterodera trifolii]|uniref:BZIP domain-containing protein n=1 Tax=Heterodera trifolii TaxID=157864 RepID=A0ABD2INA0_9BILA